MKDEPRPCERLCKRCHQWKHHSRFHVKKKAKSGNSTVATVFSSICRDCEQKERNEKKNADRPLAIIKQRAASAAGKAGTTVEFFWKQMNYSALVEMFRSALNGPCRSCGHKTLNERDVQ